VVVTHTHAHAQELFEKAGRPLVESFLGGYNATIFGVRLCVSMRAYVCLFVSVFLLFVLVSLLCLSVSWGAITRPSLVCDCVCVCVCVCLCVCVSVCLCLGGYNATIVGVRLCVSLCVCMLVSGRL
jgi:hypothetical protein